ncbi:hypothetical protein [Aquifex aeolicus]|uniref:hypothetical protein n=1 Tax=Aquifex aeolicus TaxID=63363 RepID=UPI00030AC078|nr:hypothetical protein [Aquifex aeolicus]
MKLVEKLREVKEKIKNPFNYEGLEKDFMEIEELLEKASKEEVEKAYKEYEEVKRLFWRNVEILRKLYEVG